MPGRWLLGNLIDGTIRANTLPTAAGGKFSRDVLNDGDATVDVILKGSGYETTWTAVFDEGQTYLAFVDDNDEILYFGVLIKRNLSSKLGKLTLTAREPEELLRSRFVIGGASKIVDADAGRKFTAATWGGVMAEVIKFWASSDGLPSGSPRPPGILGTVETAAGSTNSWTAVYADRPTVDEALNTISQDYTAGGIEWRASPRWATEAKAKIVLDWTFGTQAQPKIGFGTTFNFDLDDTSPSRPKISVFEPQTSTAGYYNRIWGQSKPGGGDEDIDLTPMYTGGSNKVLVEHYWSAGVELTASEMSAHLAARLDAAQGGELSMNISVEEVEDFSVWIARLGNRITVSGSLAPTSFVMRLAGVHIRDDARSVSLELVAPSVRLPRLPSHGSRNILTNPLSPGNSPALKLTPGFGGGGGDPWNPGEPGDIGGGAGIEWGTGGAVPGMDPPETGTGSDWEIGNQAVMPMGVTGHVTQNSGNVIFRAANASQAVSNAVPGVDYPTQPAASHFSTYDINIVVGSGYLQEGQFLGERLDARLKIDGSLAYQLVTDGLANGYWTKPEPVMGGYDYNYFTGSSITVRTEGAVAIGMKYLVPVEVSLAWDTSPQGGGYNYVYSNFFTFLWAEYQPSTLSLTPFTIMPGRYGQAGAAPSSSVRAGKWIIVKDGASGNFRARTVDDPPVAEGWVAYPSSGFSFGTGTLAIAKPIRMGLAGRYAYAAGLMNGNTPAVQQIKLLGSSDSAPTPVPNEDWHIPGYLTSPLGSNRADIGAFTHQGRVFGIVGIYDSAFGGVKVYSPEEDSDGNVSWPEVGTFTYLAHLDSSGSNSRASAKVMSYRDYVYYVTSTTAAEIASAKLTYNPEETP